MKPYYSDALVTLYHGRQEDVLPALDTAAVHLLLADPPYQLEARGGGIGARRAYLTEGIAGKLDGGFDMAMLALFPNWMCFGSKAQIAPLINAAADRRWMLVTWCKSDPAPLCHGNYLPDTEYLVHAWRPGRLFGEYRDKSRFFVSRGGGGEFTHPTVKPIPLMSKLVRLGTAPGDLVLDPYSGTGSTLLAAKLLGRRAIGVELEERWCEVAAQRLSQGVLGL